MKDQIQNPAFDESETDQQIVEFGMTQEQLDFMEWAIEETIRDDWEKLQKKERERGATGQQKSHGRSL